MPNPPCDRILTELRSMLSDEGLAPGARLATERVLSERLVVNRATLRKALSRLEVEGAIVRRVGSGTFVAAAPANTLTACASPLELMDARLALEPVVGREAALRARPDDLRTLAHCLEQSEGSDDFANFERWDIAFHKALAEATQNRIFVSVMETLHQMRSTNDWDRLKRASFSAALRDRYRSEHRAIFAALDDRDQITAATAVFRHMQSVRTAFTGIP